MGRLLAARPSGHSSGAPGCCQDAHSVTESQRNPNAPPFDRPGGRGDPCTPTSPSPLGRTRDSTTTATDRLDRRRPVARDRRVQQHAGGARPHRSQGDRDQGRRWPHGRQDLRDHRLVHAAASRPPSSAHLDLSTITIAGASTSRTRRPGSASTRRPCSARSSMRSSSATPPRYKIDGRARRHGRGTADKYDKVPVPTASDNPAGDATDITKLVDPAPGRARQAAVAADQGRRREVR